MSIPCGLGYRDEIADATIASRERLDVVEVMAEHYTTPRQLLALQKIADTFPKVVPHGVNLSIGSTGRVPRQELLNMRRVCEVTRATYYSDHLAMTSVGSVDLGHLTPVWYTEEVLAQTIERVREVQDFLGLRLVLENISIFFPLPGAQMGEAEFMHRLTDATECGFLFDVTNLFINSVNHRFDPHVRLREMPRHAAVQVHLAGGYMADGQMVDGHNSPVHEESWTLLGELVEAGPPLEAVILEHDTDFPHIDQLLVQVDRARRTVNPAERVGVA